ncbi:hypothetical protein C8F01DRAFT_1239188 [Mycena amicta]|nr:hypothetical protein C8F01DRAFT_1239188 [Mycena amicta]
MAMEQQSAAAEIVPPTEAAGCRSRNRRIIGQHQPSHWHARHRAGIPTIILPNRTKGAGGGKKKKKKGGGKLAAAGPGTGVVGEWWERWETYGDHPRYRNQYESFISPPNQLHLACDDFDKHYDITPLQSSPHKHLKDLFDALRRFVGARDGKSNQKLGRGTDVDAEEPISDDEEMALEDGAVGVPHEDPTPPVTDNASCARRRRRRHDPRSPQAQRFLDDPERAVKIFLSSFMHEKGLVSEHRKLTAAPRLMPFFLRFLARTGVIPTSDESMANALKVVEQAAMDLPATLTISAALPEAFAQACEHAWGRAYSLTLVTEAITPDVDGGGWGGSTGWDDDAEPTTTPDAGWGDPTPPADSSATTPSFVPLGPPKTLESLLGSTCAEVVERTMRAGLVEQSMRRVLSVSVPTGTGTLAHVVLAPWLDWKPQPQVNDDDQNTAPHIVSPSPSSSPSALPHDMRKDDITLWWWWWISISVLEPR